MFAESLAVVLQLKNVLMAVLGTAIGIFFGALPGIGPALAIALMLPFTFGMPPVTSLILLGSIYGGAIYGGSISAILLNTPGTTGSVATAIDGYPMAQKGQAGVALGISAFSSFIGGVFGLTCLLLLAPPIARLALNFGPAEYFMLALLGLSILSSTVSQGSVVKGFAMAGLGLLLSFVGYDIITGYARFTFGLDYLEDGIPQLQAITGLFAISQALVLAEQGTTIARAGKISGSVWDGIKETIRHPVTVLRGAVIGVLVGTMPGVGMATAQFIAYNETVRASKEPETFGKGNPEGVIACETCNNATEGGALIPTLTLGIPGSLTATLFLTALLIQGLRPGMELFSGPSGGVATTAVLGMLLGYVFMLGLGLFGARYFAKVTVLPYQLLVPAIIILTLTGSFAVRNSLEDVFLTVVFGLVGYYLSRHGYPLVPLILGLILGQIAEKNFHRALLTAAGSYAVFVTRPVSLIIFALTVLAVLHPVLRKLRFQHGFGRGSRGSATV